MRNPHRVRRLVLASTACGLGGVPGSPGRARTSRHAAALLLAPLPAGERPPDVRTGSRTRTGSSCTSRCSARRSRPPTVWGYASQLYATAGWTSLPWLHRIAAPTLVLTGGEGPDRPVDQRADPRRPHPTRNGAHRPRRRPPAAHGPRRRYRRAHHRLPPNRRVRNLRSARAHPLQPRTLHRPDGPRHAAV